MSFFRSAQPCNQNSLIYTLRTSFISNEICSLLHQLFPFSLSATQRRTDLSENNDDQPPETNECGKISLNVSTSINEEASTDVIVHYAPPAGIVNLGLKSDS